jgi:hypothetical protein
MTARFVIPALGPLFAAGALAAWGLGSRSKAEAPSYSGRCARATPLHETRETSLERLVARTVHELQ